MWRPWSRLAASEIVVAVHALDRLLQRAEIDLVERALAPLRHVVIAHMRHRRGRLAHDGRDVVAHVLLGGLGHFRDAGRQRVDPGLQLLRRRRIGRLPPHARVRAGRDAHALQLLPRLAIERAGPLRDPGGRLVAAAARLHALAAPARGDDHALHVARERADGGFLVVAQLDAARERELLAQGALVSELHVPVDGAQSAP